MREYLALNQGALDLLYAGAQLKRARFHINWNEFGSFLNHLSPLRHALRLLKLDALRHVLDQNAGEATHSLVAATQVAESLAADPSITSNLVFHGLAGIVLSGYEEVLSRITLSPGQLQQLQDALNRPSLTTLSAMEHAIAGEAAFLERPEDTLVRASRQGTPTSFIYATGWTLFAALRLAGVRAFTDIADGRTLIDVLEWAHVPPAQLAESLRPDATEESPLAVRPEPDVEVTRAAFSQYYAQGYMYEGIYRGALLTMATTALAQAALAVERYDRATGEWPERIDAVVPKYLDAVPEDPFTGAPIRFRKTDTGYLLYSAGWNCRDDGGIPPPEGKGWWGGGDVLFEVRTAGRS
ncbi:MAG: hypothetical protein IT368_02295 [Candidatus Hydrogenedentes bacterium]|nr:hypothetical protein [Candidatus Hydrogenedentota bacterium]